MGGILFQEACYFHVVLRISVVQRGTVDPSRSHIFRCSRLFRTELWISIWSRSSLSYTKLTATHIILYHGLNIPILDFAGGPQIVVMRGRFFSRCRVRPLRRALLLQAFSQSSSLEDVSADHGDHAVPVLGE